MYRPPAFREDRPDVLRRMIHAHPLATLVTYGEAGLTANLVPFTLETGPDGGDLLRAHLAKGNGQLDDLRRGTEALVIFHGPQAYVSPGWYPTKREHGKVVPTWNYIVVQAWGCPRVVDDRDWLRAQIDALTTAQERHRPDPWSIDDAPARFIAGQLGGIAGVEIPIRRIEGKWKASQNQPEVNRAGIVAGLREADAGSPMAGIVDAAG